MIMEEYSVNLTEYAIEQMEEIVEYISKTLKEPDAAKKWSLKIQKAVSALNEIPLRFPLIDKEPWYSENIRKMTVGNFIVYYWTDEEHLTVWITAVVYGGRDQLFALKNMPKPN